MISSGLKGVAKWKKGEEVARKICNDPSHHQPVALYILFVNPDMKQVHQLVLSTLYKGELLTTDIKGLL